MAKKTGAKDRKKSELVTPSHGVGKIWSGVAANQKAGTGRPPNELRQLLRGDAMVWRDKIMGLAAQTEPCEECGRVFDESDMTRILDVSLKYGLGPRKGGVLNEGLVRALAADVQAEIGDDQDLLGRIHERWVMTLGAHAKERS